ncbi:helicase [Azospirillum palustre]|uniref:Helicase n=1 Tax=Azospirillum palustre TaxID=2044885 RepID=A0A2B8BF78_9PROT|nr:DEAD/DEAH box helicase [Azospirillum palustre]PGH55907.1 helicase [Azospirillum palustre]
MKHAPLQLRPYQRKNADEILACLERGVRGVLYVLPTAGGKTVVVVGGVIRTVVDHGWPTVFLVHRRELLQQSLRQLAAVGIDAAIVDPDHDPDPTALVHVCSIDTLKARKGRLAAWLRTIRLVVVDEAHHTVAPGWQALLEAMPNAQRLGVTATPFRGDGKPLGDLFETVVRGPSVAELTAAGFLCPAEVWAPYSPDLSGVKISRGDFVAADLDRAMNNDKVTRLAMNAYAARMPTEPAIIFCTSVAHAQRVAEMFTAGQWKARSVDGNMDVAERDRAIADLAAGEIQVLTSCMIISEGTDIPVVAGAIFLRPTKSAQLYMQQAGRVLRINPSKKRACIIDLADNVKLHGMPEADRTWSLKSGLIQSSASTVRCPKCHRRVFPTQRCPTPRCGYVFVDRQPVVVRRIELLSDRDMHSFSVPELEAMAETDKDLQRIGRVKGCQPAWFFHARKRVAARQAKQYGLRRYA